MRDHGRATCFFQDDTFVHRIHTHTYTDKLCQFSRLCVHTCGRTYVRVSLVLWTCLAGSAFSDSKVFALVGGTNGRSVYRSVSRAREPPIENAIRAQTDAILDSFFPHESQRGCLGLPWPARAIPDVCALLSSSQFQIDIWAGDRKQQYIFSLRENICVSI